MSSQSIVCASCGAAVPYGRLSCPACGELLASVVGAARPAVAERAPKRATRAARSTAAVPSILLDVEPGDPEPAWPESRPEAPPAQPIGGSDAIDTRDVPGAAGSFAPQSYEPPLAAGAPVAPVAAYSSIATAPGAYVPPVVPEIPAGPPAPARAWAGHPAGDVPDAAQESTSSAGALVDAERLPEFLGWLAVAGSAMAAVGFLLPWGISVIGASGVGYFDRWGLAGPFHPLVVIGLLAVLGLALVRNPIPLWIRVGLAGLGLGALLLGLIWPYLLALRGTGPGVLVVALGAILLGVAGVVALVTDRHATEDRAV